MKSFAQLYMAMVCLGMATSASAGDWPQFRGPDGSGRAPDKQPLPAEIGPTKNVVWKAELPPGHSSPAVVGDRVYVTGVRDKQLVTIALDRASGKILWETEAPHTTLEQVHQIGSHAQSSPAADSERVVVFFGSCGLFCYDRAGKQLWHRPMGPFKNDFGAGSSPVLVGDWVLLGQDHDEGSFLEAIDKRTGQRVWRNDRSEFSAVGCTPVDLGNRGQEEDQRCAVGYDLETGKEIWTVRGISRTVCMTPVIGEDNRLFLAAYSAGGDEGARIEVEPFDSIIKGLDKNGNGKLERDEVPKGPILERFVQVDMNKDGSITREEYERFRMLFQKSQNVVLAVRPGGNGDITESHVEWRNGKQVPFCSSPLQVNGVVFTVKDGGFLSSLDAKDGALIKRDRISAGSGNYYASPVSGDGKVYVLSERGKLTVLSDSREWEEVSSADFKEDVYATPAVVGGKIYLRTAGHLYCFGAAGKK